MRHKTRIILIAGLLGTFLSAPASEATEKLSRLRVSDNGRFLVKEDSSPFFWLGDTAWNLFQRTSLEDEPNQPAIERYFAARARQGFTVIQATLIMGIKSNVYGHHPFTTGDSPRANVRPKPNNDYWDMADRLIELGEKHGLYMALLPIWLSSLNDSQPIVRDPQVAYRYGHFLGNRYGKRTHIIWVLGGDPWGKGKDVDNPIRLAMTRALAEGIADGVSGIDRQNGNADWSTTLMTFHPKGGHHSSSELLHAEPWLDFNMIQTTTHFSVHNYETVTIDYRKAPVKPTLDGEVAYENSLSLRKEEPQDRRITPSDVRRAAYWAVFAGGFGHTYGHRSFMQWTRKGEDTGRGGDVPWYEVLDSPGANQMRHLRALIESRPFLSRVPDQGFLAGNAGSGDEHIQATRGDGYAFIYTPMGRPFSVRLGIISGKTVQASWFDPRTGNTKPDGTFANSGTHEFVPPGRPGPGNDWILILDDSARDFPSPAEPVERFGFYSATFTAAGQYDNPYKDLHATAILHCPDGETRSLPLFWDGEDCWRLRLSPDAVGTWRFAVRSPDQGLDGRTGQFECIASGRKGSIRPMRGFSHHFERQDGTPFLFWGDTAWALFQDEASEELDRQAVCHYIDERARQGVNVVHSMLLQEAGWGNRNGDPFEDIAGETLNPAYWQEIDLRLRYLNDKGIIGGLVLAWGDKQKREPFAWRRFPSVEARKSYARYIAARYGAYDVYFLVSGEWQAEIRTRDNTTEEAVQREFIEIGDALKEADAHGRMIGIHPMTAGGSVREFNRAEWMSFADYQQNYTTLHARILESRSFDGPIVNSEYGYLLRDSDYDGIVDKHNSFSVDDIRQATWDIIMAGGYPVTGYASTYMGGYRDKGPFNVDDPRNDPWEQQYDLARQFLAGLDWWKLEPRDGWIRSATPRSADRQIVTKGRTRRTLCGAPKTAYWLLAEPGRHYVAYVRGLTAEIIIELGGGKGVYRARLFDPRTGRITNLAAGSQPSERFTFTPPDTDDWIVHLVRTRAVEAEDEAYPPPVTLAEAVIAGGF